MPDIRTEIPTGREYYKGGSRIPINGALDRRPESEDALLNDMKIWTDNTDTGKWYYIAIQEASNSHEYSLKDNGYEIWTLPSKPLGHWTFWGAERGGDNLLVVYWLYDITGDESLLALGI